MKTENGRVKTAALVQEMALYNRKLHLFTVFTAAAGVFLIAAGASVTSTGSGDAVPDWPLSFGRLHPPMMVGGVFYEHGHRMIAALVALLIAVQAVWLAKAEPRRWVRRLGWIALASVLVQAVLGGLRVLVVSNETLQDITLRFAGLNHVDPARIGIGVLHAVLGQIVLCMTFAIALSTSLSWLRATPPRIAIPLRAYKFGLFAIGAVILQLLFGAVMRHSGAGLVIPDFPLSHGKIIPPLNDLPNYDPNAAIYITYGELTFKTVVNFLHRTWAYFVAGLLIWNMIWLMRSGRKGYGMVYTVAHLLAGLVIVQFWLGATTIWTGKNVWVSVFHVMTGAILLGTCVLYTMWCRRLQAVAVETPVKLSHVEVHA
jgi:cytochrome c oxidase assembly protein subunit 15